MAKRKRNYRAEYQRRLARAKEKGYSKAVARGHAPKGKLGIKAAKFLNKKVGSDVVDRAFVSGVLHVDRNDRFEQTRGILRKHLAELLGVSEKVVRSKLVRRKGEDIFDYQQKRYDLLERIRHANDLDFVDETAFTKSMMGLGFTETEAYTLWFSP